MRVWRGVSPPVLPPPVLAMQKVVGSSPIIRFTIGPANAGLSFLVRQRAGGVGAALWQEDYEPCRSAGRKSGDVSTGRAANQAWRRPQAEVAHGAHYFIRKFIYTGTEPESEGARDRP
jgi:hypothetical protein